MHIDGKFYFPYSRKYSKQLLNFTHETEWTPSRPTIFQKIWQRRESNPDLWICSQEL
jgi:hypothetical protein